MSISFEMFSGKLPGLVFLPQLSLFPGGSHWGPGVPGVVTL
jgi:hypothetical protein